MLLICRQNLAAETSLAILEVMYEAAQPPTPVPVLQGQ